MLSKELISELEAMTTDNFVNGSSYDIHKRGKQLKALARAILELNNHREEEDPFFSLLSLWVTSHPGQEICTKELYNDLRALAKDKGLSFTLPDARALGVKIKQSENELKERYGLTSRTGAGNIRYYTFHETRKN